MHPDKPLKALLLRNDNWLTYLRENVHHIRDAVLENVTKMLACGTAAFGSREYHCRRSGCTHIKFINQTCKSRACNSCGVKATERWIRQQQHVLPDCEWQHITFTLPSSLWEVFRHNRWLLNDLSACAADILLGWAKSKHLDIGIFCALHTYGRKLNWNTHLHLSVTRGGLCTRTGVWKPIYFKLKNTEACWRAAVITLMRKHYDHLDLTFDGAPFVRHAVDWSRFLDSQYRRRWKLHFAKKTQHIRQTVNYLGRYLKRPPVSASRLRHYGDNGMLTFEFLNHRTGKTETLTVTPMEMIARIVEHIPDKHFRMIRYYGFLSNRRRGEALPRVYEALEMAQSDAPAMPAYATLLKGYVKVDPYECILCADRMVFSGFRAGSPLSELVASSVIQAAMRAA